ncbi:MAG: acetyl-CoA carboxylase biotin carboxylase subunit [Thermoleophilia bacterium]
MFKKILVANRGEITVRIIRACRELDIPVVVVYSDADRLALHVRYADEAYSIGPAPSIESYLVAERIIEVALRSGAEAVHPGYGFLSENHRFARMCEEAGLVFIGPSPCAMEAMGDKLQARRAMEAAGVPLVPGTPVLNSAEEARALIAPIGYPIVLKPSGGGGGKGMRVVEREEDVAGALASARSEASSSFGDDSVYAERFVVRPRHVEIQVLGDNHGNVVHLFERECSIQRRHQKIVEEAPSPFIDPETRIAMGEAAVRAARSVDYAGAGTVEFLVDSERRFYFLEMNTRLQVEHAVTELVTGIDLVKMQLAVAAGGPLPFAQGDITLNGAAVECRIYAEDPDRDFMPSPGRITALRAPGGPGVRDDIGVYEGYEVPLYYDPLLSKLSAWGRDRDEAIGRLRRALSEYVIEGIKTNIPFHLRLLRHPDFLSGDVDTTFVDRRLLAREGVDTCPDAELALVATAVLAAMHEGAQTALAGAAGTAADAGGGSPAWRRAGRNAAAAGGCGAG